MLVKHSDSHICAIELNKNIKKNKIKSRLTNLNFFLACYSKHNLIFFFAQCNASKTCRRNGSVNLDKTAP